MAVGDAMKYYLDTNILIDLCHTIDRDVSHRVLNIITDCSNILITSTVCAQELIHLYKIGKLSKKKDKANGAEKVLQTLDNLGVDIVPVTKKHLQQFAELNLFEDHRDPNDRLIIAQAISDHTPLISSDRKFDKYCGYGLKLVFNER